VFSPHRIGALLAAFGLGWVSLIGPAVAGPSGLDSRLDSITISAEMVEKRLARLEKEYGHRRGLIGAQAAEARFQDAVFAYLVEDYDRAATTFFTLVEAEALIDPDLVHDAEWYLGECLFEEGNLVTAVEAYERIIRAGSTHPFFQDAVRRQIEAYGLLKDRQSFYQVYNRFIVTGIVPTTDAVKYSVAKSFYHQGDSARAKALFGEIQASGGFYTRARYFIGAILVSENQLDLAVKQFEAVDSHAPPEQAQDYHGYGGIRAYAQMRAIESEVHELARLALGRLHYEQGRYDQAQRYYQDIHPEGTYFTDQMYELVWTYVKQEKWLEAINQIEICLIADPDHLYAFQLRLLLGHLNMRRKDHNRALATYEEVVGTYGPIRDYLKELERGTADHEVFFTSIVETEERSSVDARLPAFAVDLLVGHEHMGRAVEARRMLDQQTEDLEYSRELIDLVSPVLRSGTEGIGTFRQGRAALTTIYQDDLKLRADLTDFELSWLQTYADASARSRLVVLRERWEILVGRTGQVRSIETNATERQAAHETQIREVQQKAFQVQQVALDQRAQVTAIRRRLRENAAGLNDADVVQVQRGLDQVQSDLRDHTDALERSQGENTRRRVMTTVSGGVAVDTIAQRSMIGDDLRRLHQDLVEMRRGVSAPTDAYRRVDSLWSLSENFEQRASQTFSKLEQAEQAELAIMRDRLSQELAGMSGLGGDLSGTSDEMNSLAKGITRAGIGRVEGTFDETVMGADRGILDVYWVKKGNVKSESERLGIEQGKRENELKERFLLIRSRLDDGVEDSARGGK